MKDKARKASAENEMYLAEDKKGSKISHSHKKKFK